MLVTRATREQEMGQAVTTQVLHPRALAVAAAIMALMGIVPGMPNVPFLILAALLGYAAWRLPSARRSAGAGDRRRSAAAAAAQPELSWDDLARSIRWAWKSATA